MIDIENQIIVHLFGETDFTSFTLRKDAFEGAQKKIFDTPEGDDYVQILGQLMGSDNWDQLRTRTAQNGMSYETLVAEALVSLVAGTDTLNFALDRGYNLVALGVFRKTYNNGAPVFSARFMGTSMTSTSDPHAHLELVREGSKAMAPFIYEDIANGDIAEDSVIASMIAGGNSSTNGAADTAEAGQDDEASALETSIFFHELVTENGIETVIICACDPDLADAAGRAEDLTVGLVSGVVPTPYGSVGYWLWQVAPDTPQGFLQEQFIDLGSFPSQFYDRMKDAAHVRFLVVDRTTQENTRAVLLSSRSLGLSEFEAMAIEIAESEDSDFEKAARHVMHSVDPEEFLQHARKQQSGKTNLH